MNNDHNNKYFRNIKLKFYSYDHNNNQFHLLTEISVQHDFFFFFFGKHITLLI